MKKVTKAVAALMLMTAVVFAAGCKKDNSGIMDGHEYVDLGLPSGNLWATCNLGSYTPEGYGFYFAWGETQPKDYYDWNTYKHCHGAANMLTKYCSDSTWGYNGYTDNLHFLESDDDAAAYHLGDGWRMPKHEDWVELYHNTTWFFSSQNGVNGLLFTASNGNSIFLPAAGTKGSELDETYGQNLYWMNWIDGNDQSQAFATLFDSYNWWPTVGHFRCVGCPIRPVRSAK